MCSQVTDRKQLDRQTERQTWEKQQSPSSKNVIWKFSKDKFFVNLRLYVNGSSEYDLNIIQWIHFSKKISSDELKNNNKKKVLNL